MLQCIDGTLLFHLPGSEQVYRLYLPHTISTAGVHMWYVNKYRMQWGSRGGGGGTLWCSSRKEADFLVLEAAESSSLRLPRMVKRAWSSSVTRSTPLTTSVVGSPAADDSM